MESQTAKARNRSRDAEALLHSEASSYKPNTVKSRGTCEWDRWGRLSEDGPGHYNPDRSEGPWGRGTASLAWRCFSQSASRLDRVNGGRNGSTKDGRKPRNGMGMPGAGLTGTISGKASSDKPALKPYWGKPAVRNFRGDHGNVGIIRSPVRAMVLPDVNLLVRIWEGPGRQRPGLLDRAIPHGPTWDERQVRYGNPTLPNAAATVVNRGEGPGILA